MTAQVFQDINFKIVEAGLDCLELTTESVIKMGRKPFVKRIKEEIKTLNKSNINPKIFRQQIDRLCFK
jgi:hypothetical protein